LTVPTRCSIGNLQLGRAGEGQLADDRFEVSASPSSFAGHLMQASIQAPDSDLD
jgi:hypothetical protein